MMAKPLSITLETVTPVWTGGADGKADRLHATGIMGSLRWWYEALVRGVGGRVCNAGKPCIYAEKERYQGLCDVCRIFGATGWTRRFKLIVENGDLHSEQPSASTIDPKSGMLVFTLPEGSKWYLPAEPLVGSFTLSIVPTLPLKVTKLLSKGEEPEYLDASVIGALVQFIADRASLGAKPQLGLGIVSLRKRLSTQPLYQHLEQLISLHEKNRDSRPFNEYDELPSLHNMFFASIKVEQATELETFSLKYHMRHLDGPFGERNLRHRIMGYVPQRGERENREGAKILMSFPYDNTIRLWGWIPRRDNASPTRNDILDNIWAFLGKEYDEGSVPFWVDFASSTGSGKAVLAHFKKYLLEEAK